MNFSKLFSTARGKGHLATTTRTTPTLEVYIMKAIFYRKAPSTKEMRPGSYFLDGPAAYTVAEEIQLTPSQYDYLAEDLLADYPAISGKGGCINGVIQAIRISAPGRKALIVDPQGYDYPKYVAFEA